MNAIDLASMRGYPTTDKQIASIMLGYGGFNVSQYHISRSFLCVALLIEALRYKYSVQNPLGKSKLPSKKNTPLHWALYHGDSLLGMLVFLENPLMMTKLNEDL